MLKQKFGGIGKVLGIFLSIWFIVYPVMAQSWQRAMVDAEMQARNDVNGTLWMGIGCLFGVFGVAAGYLFAFNSPPGGALMGKSPDYVAAYTDAYSSQVKRIQGSKALIGCILWTGIWVLLYFLLWYETTSSTYYYYWW